MAIKIIKKETMTIPPGKVKCYITGKLRKDTPEEHVRQRMARSLVEEYGYEKEDIEIEFVIPMGTAKKKADIVVFLPKQTHKLENVSIIVEAKRDSIKPTHADQGIAQLHSYMSASPNAKFGHWIGSESRSYAKIYDKGTIQFVEEIDIPFADGKFSSTLDFTSLVPATDVLKDVFKRCHNYISANQGGSKELAFHEFLKITFCKVFDERFSEKPKFFVEIHQKLSPTSQSEVKSRIQSLFDDVCKHYGYIFGESEKIELKPNVVTYIVSELQKYSLLDTDFDYKGQAYEEIVGANSRGERGEFFTPRNLCQLAVDICFDLVGKENAEKIRVMDPACGTGGFLRTYIHKLFNQILERELAKWGDTQKARSKANETLKSLCDKNVFGIDFNPVLVRAAQMNLVMHGDGSSNIFHENALLSWGEWGEETRAKVTDGSFDLIISNPPFGDDLLVDDPHILEQFALSTFPSRKQRSSMAPQELFVERCHRLLKPSGLLAIITPDNLLSNPSYKFLRHWLLANYMLRASISLPVEMFQPSTGTQTSLLILRKRPKTFSTLKEVTKKASEEPLFLSIPKKIGHDQRGSFVPLRDDSGDIVMQNFVKTKFVRSSSGDWVQEDFEILEPLADDQLPEVFEDFLSWKAEIEGEL